MPGEPKNHHYVPKMILRRFKSDQGEFYFFNKERPEKGVEHRNLDKVFCDRHIYSSILTDGSKQAILERFFSRMENDASRLFDEIERIVQSGEVPNLTENQKRFFINYLYRQWKRSPDLLREHTSKERFDELVVEIVAEKFSGDELEIKLREIDNLTDEQVQRIYHNAKVQAIAAGFDDLEDIFMDRPLIFAAPFEPSRGYIISSNPILRDTYGETSDLRDKTDIIMPISKQLAIGFAHIGRANTLVRQDRNMVRKINHHLVRQSVEIAGPSIRQLKSLINPR